MKKEKKRSRTNERINYSKSFHPSRDAAATVIIIIDSYKLLLYNNHFQNGACDSGMDNNKQTRSNYNITPR
jgi:hypothetical protein